MGKKLRAEMKIAPVFLVFILLMSSVASINVHFENYASAAFNFCLIQVLLVFMFYAMRIDAEEREIQRIRLLIESTRLGSK